jgi:hypothetical protein
MLAVSTLTSSQTPAFPKGYCQTSLLHVFSAAPEPEPDTRDEFTFIDEKPPHKLVAFPTYSDISWGILRRVMAGHAAKIGM